MALMKPLYPVDDLVETVKVLKEKNPEADEMALCYYVAWEATKFLMNRPSLTRLLLSPVDVTRND